MAPMWRDTIYVVKCCVSHFLLELHRAFGGRKRIQSWKSAARVQSERERASDIRMHTKRQIQTNAKHRQKNASPNELTIKI